MILPDINVWLSLVSSSHQGHRSSKEWLANVPLHESVVFCRVTQLGMLRLLTTPSVMEDEVMTQRRAWQVYEDLLLDQRIDLIADPPGLTEHLKRLADRDEISPKRWVDDYLAAFAQSAGIQLVTFDRVLAVRQSGSLRLVF